MGKVIKKLAIVYKFTIHIKCKEYIFIGHTFDLEKTKSDLLLELKNKEHKNKKLQKKFDEVEFFDPLLAGLYFNFKTLQALRPDYYPRNVLPMVMEQLEKSFIEEIRTDYKSKGKEYLILNEIH
ncbi:MAG: hypothetical protein ACRCXT_16420 [Paraclostridium sp.]